MDFRSIIHTAGPNQNEVKKLQVALVGKSPKNNLSKIYQNRPEEIVCPKS